MSRTAVVVLGAGWSYVAGRPLARDLFRQAPATPTPTAGTTVAEVLRLWARWEAEHVGGTAEQFIGYMSDRSAWPAVLSFIHARLAEPDRVRSEHELRYGETIRKPSPAPIHHEFLDRVLSEYDLLGVVTTNYDLLAERTLRHRPMQRPARPGFYYPGMARGPLVGSGLFSASHRTTVLTGRVPLCKLHGSLNWERTQDGIRAYADCRAAFRMTGGSSYIVAPRPEKAAPSVMTPIWSEAERLLTLADAWIVVGYSAPSYDVEVSRLLATCSAGRSLEVHVVDPSRPVADRYEALTDRPVVWAPDLATFCR